MIANAIMQITTLMTLDRIQHFIEIKM